MNKEKGPKRVKCGKRKRKEKNRKKDSENKENMCKRKKMSGKSERAFILFYILYLECRQGESSQFS